MYEISKNDNNNYIFLYVLFLRENMHKFVYGYLNLKIIKYIYHNKHFVRFL